MRSKPLQFRKNAAQACDSPRAVLTAYLEAHRGSRTGAQLRVALPWGGEIGLSHGAIVFMLIALTTCILLVPPGWQRSPAAA